jgi:hypothetical protein
VGVDSGGENQQRGAAEHSIDRPKPQTDHCGVHADINYRPTVRFGDPRRSWRSSDGDDRGRALGGFGVYLGLGAEAVEQDDESTATTT